MPPSSPYRCAEWADHRGPLVEGLFARLLASRRARALVFCSSRLRAHRTARRLRDSVVERLGYTSFTVTIDCRPAKPAGLRV